MQVTLAGSCKSYLTAIKFSIMFQIKLNTNFLKKQLKVWNITKLTEADSLLRLGEGVDGELDMIWYASVWVGTGIGSDEGEVLGV